MQSSSSRSFTASDNQEPGQDVYEPQPAPRREPIKVPRRSGRRSRGCVLIDTPAIDEGRPWGSHCPRRPARACARRPGRRAVQVTPVPQAPRAARSPSPRSSSRRARSRSRGCRRGRRRARESTRTTRSAIGDRSSGPTPRHHNRLLVGGRIVEHGEQSLAERQFGVAARVEVGAHVAELAAVEPHELVARAALELDPE